MKLKHAIRRPDKVVKKIVKESAKVVKKVDDTTQKLTKPITEPVAKVIAPVVAPVAQIITPINKVLSPVNAVLTPVAILTGGGTLQQAVAAVVKGQVVDKMVAPITNTVNHIINPVDAVIGDAMEPVVSVIATIDSADTLTKNVPEIADNLMPPKPVVQKAELMQPVQSKPKPITQQFFQPKSVGQQIPPSTPVVQQIPPKPTQQFFEGWGGAQCTRRDILIATNAMNNLNERHGTSELIANGWRNIRWECAAENIKVPDANEAKFKP
ncbi:MAG: hypothetical protein EPO11_07600 [Gammaproteobacteria bacterium]|nr:MAG: hypothetical protein EPO11_07600 [Gammaproteobacteria bacterium]